MNAERLRRLARLDDGVDQVADDELAALEQRRGRGRLSACGAAYVDRCAEYGLYWHGWELLRQAPNCAWWCESPYLGQCWRVMTSGGWCAGKGSVWRPGWPGWAEPTTSPATEGRCRVRHPTDCPP